MSSSIGQLKYSCKYPYCKNGMYINIISETYKKKRLFQFPKHPPTAKIWKSFCNISDDVNATNFHLCEDHFSNKDFYNSGRLQRRSIPKFPLPRTDLTKSMVSVGSATSTETNTSSKSVVERPQSPIYSTETTLEEYELAPEDMAVMISMEISAETDVPLNNCIPQLPPSRIDLTETTSDNELLPEDTEVVMVSRGTSTEIDATLSKSVTNLPSIDLTETHFEDVVVMNTKGISTETNISLNKSGFKSLITSFNFNKEENDKFSKQLISNRNATFTLEKRGPHSRNSASERKSNKIHRKVVPTLSKAPNNNNRTKVFGSAFSNFNREKTDGSKTFILREVGPYSRNSTSERASHQLHGKVVSKLSKVESLLTTARAELNSIRKLYKSRRFKDVHKKLNGRRIEFVNSQLRHVKKIHKRRWSI